jgi:hypothetical protein
MGIAPVPNLRGTGANSRGPKATDPGPRDFLYSTEYAFCPEKYVRTVHRALTNGISNGRGSQVGGIKEGEGEIVVVARNLGSVRGAGGAAGGSTGSTVRHGDLRARGTRRTPDAKRKSTIFCSQTSCVQ